MGVESVRAPERPLLAEPVVPLSSRPRARRGSRTRTRQLPWGGPSGLDPTVDTDAAWFLARASPLIPIFEPTFSFADAQEQVIKNIGDDPSKVTWPLMIFGPEMVKEIGREKLLESPAWNIEELPYGGISIQVWENPFNAPTKFVAALAEHLGLQSPER